MSDILLYWANVLWLPVLAATYVGWIVRFFQQWRRVMRWPDIALLCFGGAAFTFMAIPKFAPYFAAKTVVRYEKVQPANAPTVRPAELLALKAQNKQLETENTQLKTQIRHLKRANQPSRTVAPSTPSACSSIAPVLFPSRINADDCDALTGAQRAVDIADEQRREFLKTLPSVKGEQQTLEAVAQGETIKANLTQAIVNLQNLQARLCLTVIRATSTPTPTK
jgi:cell division protein FtsB